VIEAEPDLDGWPVLDTSDGPLAVALENGGRVEMHDLLVRGGEIGLSLDLDTSEFVATGLRVEDAGFIGIEIMGDRGLVSIDGLQAIDCGAGGGVAIRGAVVVEIEHGDFDQGDGPGVAATVSDRSELTLSRTFIRNHDAGGGAVVACTGDAVLRLSQVEFRLCGGDIVLAQGDDLAISRTTFDICAGTMIRLRGVHEFVPIHDCTMRTCTGFFLTGQERERVRVDGCLFIANVGTLIHLEEQSQLSVTQCTIAGLQDGRVANLDRFGMTMIDRTIITGVEMRPVVQFPSDPDLHSLVIRSSDFWDAEETLWYGLEDHLATYGNIEADPQYCDAGMRDFRVAEGSPCVLEIGGWMGSEGVGCD
jgi:hypothetical protein